MEDTKNVWLSADGQWCLTKVNTTESKFKLHSKQDNVEYEIIRFSFGTSCHLPQGKDNSSIPDEVWKVVNREYNRQNGILNNKKA